MCDNERLTYDDIMPGVMQFRAHEISKTRNPNGTWHREYAGEDYFETPQGKMSVKGWTEFAQKVVEENGDLPLLEAIETHVRIHCPFVKEKDLQSYSLQCLVEGAYKAWQERGEFMM